MEILETLLDIGIDMLDGFVLLYLCRSMLKECRIKRAAVYYLFVLPIAAVIFAFNHYFPTVGGHGGHTTFYPGHRAGTLPG